MSSILSDQWGSSYMSQNAGGGDGVAGSQPMRTAVHITWHGAQINFGDLTPYLTYGSRSLLMIILCLIAAYGMDKTEDSGLQGDVVYLSWPMAPLVYAGERGVGV